jgi:hypothetical protein
MWISRNLFQSFTKIGYPNVQEIENLWVDLIIYKREQDIERVKDAMVVTRIMIWCLTQIREILKDINQMMLNHVVVTLGETMIAVAVEEMMIVEEMAVEEMIEETMTVQETIEETMMDTEIAEMKIEEVIVTEGEMMTEEDDKMKYDNISKSNKNCHLLYVHLILF